MNYKPEFYDVIADGCRSSAAVIVPVLIDLFAPRSVVDIGCGEGHWLAEFASRGCRVIGVDGHHVAPERLVIDPGDFRPADLANPPAAVERHDLCLSLEVAEHLPEEAADRFITALVASAPIVVFSAAIPGQGGTGHVNEQWPGYWVTKFADHDLQCTAALRWEFWDDRRVENWYRQNLLLFASRETIADMGASAQYLWRCPLAPPWPVVHPVLWDSRR